MGRILAHMPGESMAGFKKEFEMLFDQYKSYVYKVCYQYTRSNDDALDLTQEVFVKIFKNMDKLKADRDVKPWIRRICVNTCLNHQRDKKEAISLDYDEEGQSIKDTLKDSDNTENLVFAKLTSERLKAYIQELQPEIKMAMILRHLRGLSYKEIAKAMQSPEGTIKTYIYKGRHTLLQRLKGEGILEV